MKVKDVLTLYFIPQRNSCGIRSDGKVCICLKKTCIKCFFMHYLMFDSLVKAGRAQQTSANREGTI